MNHPLLQKAITQWQQWPLAQKRAGTAAAIVVLTWWVINAGIAPAWRTLRSAPAQLDHAQVQLHTMRALAAQAQSLQRNAGATVTRLSRSEALLLLETTTQRVLDRNATLTPGPDRVNVSVQGISPPALAQWLHDVRVTTRLRPSEAQLERSNTPTGQVQWRGTVVLTGPALEQP